MKYIITGGEFNNKGAEAMTLITISRIREYDKGAEIALISGKKIPTSFKQLKIVRYSLCNNTIKYLLNDSIFALCKAWIKNIVNILSNCSEKCVAPIHTKKLYQSAEYIIDISGFALSSKFSASRSQNYLERLNIAKKYNVKTVLMPQSFGPFDFGYITRDELKTTLSFCELIYAREQESFQFLKNLGLQNIILAHDMVLVQKEVKYNLLFDNKIPITQEIVLDNSKSYVGIIPNYRTVDNVKLSLEKLMELYSQIISFLLKQQKNIFLIPHAKEDMLLCKRIKESFLYEDSVIILNYVMYSYEYQQMIANFDYIIASRYHSIIHAYKECVPALILGWAEKYNSLALLFQQTHYFFDISGEYTSDNIIDALHRINSNYKKEAEVIMSVLKKVQKKDYFCFLRCENKNDCPCRV